MGFICLILLDYLFVRCESLNLDHAIHLSPLKVCTCALWQSVTRIEAFEALHRKTIQEILSINKNHSMRIQQDAIGITKRPDRMESSGREVMMTNCTNIRWWHESQITWKNNKTMKDLVCRLPTPNPPPESPCRCSFVLGIWDVKTSMAKCPKKASMRVVIVMGSPSKQKSFWGHLRFGEYCSVGLLPHSSWRWFWYLHFLLSFYVLIQCDGMNN